jgi:hypothetical protein
MDVDKMFIVLVNIVVITLMIAQANSAMGYLFSVIFAFVEVILMVMLLREPGFNSRKFYLIMNVVVGFLFLVLYLQRRNLPYVAGLGYMLVGSFFIGIVLLSYRTRARPLSTHSVEVVDVEGEEDEHPLEVVNMDEEVVEELAEVMEKPKGKKNIFLDLEKSTQELKTRQMEADLNRQAQALVDAEKQLNRITKKLETKPKKAKRRK